MSNPFAEMAGRLSRWLHMPSISRPKATRREVERQEWVSLGISGPVPLLEMYRDVLGKHGIQAVITDAGIGPGALGGVPGFGMLRVAPTDVGIAQEILRAEIGDDEAGASSPAPE